MAQEHAIRFLWRTQKWVLLLCGAALIALAVFAAGAMTHGKSYRDPDRRQQTIEPWMTAKFVGRSHHIRPEVARELFGINGRDARRTTMAQIAADKGITFDALKALVLETAQQEDAQKRSDHLRREERRDD